MGLLTYLAQKRRAEQDQQLARQQFELQKQNAAELANYHAKQLAFEQQRNQNLANDAANRLAYQKQKDAQEQALLTTADQNKASAYNVLQNTFNGGGRNDTFSNPLTAGLYGNQSSGVPNFDLSGIGALSNENIGQIVGMLPQMMNAYTGAQAQQGTNLNIGNNARRAEDLNASLFPTQKDTALLGADTAFNQADFANTMSSDPTMLNLQKQGLYANEIGKQYPASMHLGPNEMAYGLNNQLQGATVEEGFGPPTVLPGKDGKPGMSIPGQPMRKTSFPRAMPPGMSLDLGLYGSAAHPTTTNEGIKAPVSNGGPITRIDNGQLDNPSMSELHSMLPAELFSGEALGGNSNDIRLKSLIQKYGLVPPNQQILDPIAKRAQEVELQRIREESEKNRKPKGKSTN